MKQHSAGFGVVVIIGLVAVLGIGAVIITQNTGLNDVSRESSAVSVLEDVQNTMDEATGMHDDAMTEAADAEMPENDAMEDTDMTKTDENAVVSVSDETMVKEDEVAAVSRGTFEDYSPNKLALAENGTVALFFHASWCPSCRGLENDINASLSDIPADTHILKVDYDTATALRQQYGVVRQHTLVVVDANGTEIKTLTGLTNTLEQVVAQL